jgi:hypothetical protein
VPQGQANDRERSAYVQLADVLEIVDGVLKTIPFYAYGNNEAAVRMIEALHKIRDKVLEHVVQLFLIRHMA